MEPAAKSPAILKKSAPWRVESMALATLSAIETEWRDLAARALHANIFYEPDFARAAAPVFGAHAKAVLVRDDGCALRGLFPFQNPSFRYGAISGLVMGWMHPYMTLGVPLIDRDHADAILEIWLDHLRQTQNARFLLLPQIPMESAFWQNLQRVLRNRDLAFATFDSHQRASLAPRPEARTDYLTRALNPKIRKELSRKRRRLSDLGEVRHEILEDPIAMQTVLRDFLNLEQQGWKGRKGTAVAENDDLRQFVERAVADLGHRGQARIDRLSAGGRALAVSILLRSGGKAWLWKITYDEAFARLSPGVQLTCDVTASLLRDDGLIETDSCALPDHPMIDRLWRERIALSDLLIALRPNDRAGFRLACALETLRRGARHKAKSALHRIAAMRGAD
jgi:CelD/BcsL family acetyltransferase involved in cellulose biosynthesis